MIRFFQLTLIALVLISSAAIAAGPDTSKRSKTAISKNTPIIKKSLLSKTVRLGSPVFIRIVKSKDGSLNDGYLELFLKSEYGQYDFYKSWPICTYSGDLGPKLKQGDGQSPEGFYFVTPSRMNPYSSYHLSFNLGYPNAYDRAHGRTGDYLMVHGNCVSIGCYAMTDPVIEEVYTIMNAAYDKGQPYVRVHAFPFPMTDENMAINSGNTNIEFWRNLKTGWDWFETHRKPPNVTVESKTYEFGPAN